MSAVNIASVNVLDNPSPATNPLQFEIQYEALCRLEGDLEWKLIYVGSAEDPSKDQVLDEVLLGPVEQGQYRFVFQADPPDFRKVPADDLVGVTVVLLTCSYREQEFIRVGYYVATEYQDEELRENPPDVPVIDKLWRNILADKPRVTRFPIQFDGPEDGGAAGVAATEGGPGQEGGMMVDTDMSADTSVAHGMQVGMQAVPAAADPYAAVGGAHQYEGMLAPPPLQLDVMQQ